MWQLNKNQKLILKYNYEFGIVLVTPAICAGVVALTALLMGV